MDVNNKIYFTQPIEFARIQDTVAIPTITMYIYKKKTHLFTSTTFVL